MKTASLLFFLFFSVIASMAQKQEVITVKAGTKILDYFKPDEIFLYPEFKKGNVFFKQGNTAESLLNYNRITGEVLFIEKRDTLGISNSRDVDYIEIGDDIFVFDQGYLRIINGTTKVKMAVKEYVKLIDTQKTGAYGQKSSSVAVDSYNSVYGAGSNYYKLIVNEDLIIAKKYDYFVGSRENGFLPFKKGSLYKLFPEQKTAISSYLSQNVVDFKNKEDLDRLTAYLENLK